MNFNIFSQPQGPRIDTSLFPQAAAQGAEVGQSIGTPLSNAIEGGIKGFEIGQQFRQRETQIAEAQRDIQIKDQQIKEIPLRQEILELQKEAARLQNQQTEIQIKNLPLDQRVKQAQLRNQELLAQKTQQAIDAGIFGSDPDEARKLQADQRLYRDLVADTSPEGKKRLAQELENGRFNLLLSALGDKASKQILDTSFPYYSPQYQEFYKSTRTKYDKNQFDQQALLIDALKEQPKLRSNLTSNGTAGLIKQSQGSGFSDFDLLTRGQILTEKVTDPTDANFGKEVSRFYLDGRPLREVDDEFARTFSLAKSNFDLVNSLQNGGDVFSKSLEEAARVKQLEAEKNKPQAGTVIEDVPDEPNAYKKAMGAARAKMRSKLGKAPVASVDREKTKLSSTAVYGADTFSADIQNEYVKDFVKAPQLIGKPEIVQAIALLPAMIDTESSGRKKAVSPKGARGLMQVMPGTFKYVTNKYKLKGRDIDNPDDNVEVGSIYLAEQIKTFGAVPGQGLELALAAYNGGPKYVAQALEEAEDKSWDGVKRELKRILNKNAYEEISAYPDKVIKAVIRLANSASK